METKSNIKKYIKEWENRGYKNGIPDEAPIILERINIVPSYRKICKAILKNDLSLQSLGFGKSYSKTYSTLKRIEIEQRPNKNKQLKLNL